MNARRLVGVLLLLAALWLFYVGISHRTVIWWQGVTA